MSKTKKIILIAVAAVVVLATVLTIVLIPDTDKIYDELSEKAKPSVVADFLCRKAGAYGHL